VEIINSQLRTLDGGQTWTDITDLYPIPSPSAARKTDFERVVYVNPSIAYAVGNRQNPTLSGTEISFFKTIDNGENWIDLSVNIVTTSTGTAVSMTWEDELNGWILTSDGKSLRTSNGGGSWVEGALPNLNGDMYDITIVSDLPEPTTTTTTTTTSTTTTTTTVAATYGYVLEQELIGLAGLSEYRYTITNLSATPQNIVETLVGTITESDEQIPLEGSSVITIKVDKTAPTTIVEGLTTLTWYKNDVQVAIRTIEAPNSVSGEAHTFTNVSHEDELKVTVSETSEGGDEE
jgi:photosystem II stability/assembly factor-like uncharacterized protein